MVDGQRINGSVSLSFPVLVMQPLWDSVIRLSLRLFQHSHWCMQVLCTTSFERFQVHHGWILSPSCIGIGTHHLFVFTFPILLRLAWQLRTCGGVGHWESPQDSVPMGWLYFRRSIQLVMGSLETFPMFSCVIFYGRIMEPFSDYPSRKESGTWWGTPLVYLKTLVMESWGVFVSVLLLPYNMQRKERLLFVSWLLSSVVVLALFGMPTTPIVFSPQVLYRRWFFGYSRGDWSQETGRLSSSQNFGVTSTYGACSYRTDDIKPPCRWSF